MCLDPFTRVLQRATLQDWSTEWNGIDYLEVIANITASNVTDINVTQLQVEYDEAVAASVTTTYWAVDVSA